MVVVAFAALEIGSPLGPFLIKELGLLKGEVLPKPLPKVDRIGLISPEVTVVNPPPLSC